MAGNTDQAKGKVKQAAGDLTGNDKLHAEGEADESKGVIKDKIDDVKNAAESVVDKVVDTVKKV